MRWSIIYIVSVLLANYTAEWFVPLPYFGLLALGTLVFGITFTARDYVHRLGRKYVYTMIGVTALVAFVMSLFLGVPIRIIIASVTAIVLAEAADTEVYHRLRKQNWLVRVFSSNAISVPLDTLLFTFIAFWGVFPVPVLIEIIYADILIKYAVGIVVAFFRYTRFGNPNQLSAQPAYKSWMSSRS